MHHDVRTGCAFCASLGRSAAEQPDPKDSLAVAFAEAVTTDHTAISDGQLEVLFEEFIVPQVVELLTWIVFEYAGQVFGALIGYEPATADESRVRGRGRRPAAADELRSRPGPSATETGARGLSSGLARGALRGRPIASAHGASVARSWLARR